MPIAKIVSGGQAGADRGGWDAAVYFGIPYGGWVPHGRKAEDGVIPANYAGLQEMATSDYVARKEANVADSDATIVFTYDPPSGGSKMTIDFAAKHGKPCLHIPANELPLDEAVQRIVDWFGGRLGVPAPPDQCVLNVAGQRESTRPGIQRAVALAMIKALRQINPECRDV